MLYTVLCNILYYVISTGTGDNGIEDVMRQPFFSSIDWPKLMCREMKPPFKPLPKGADDAFYFDTEFTMKTPKGSF